MHPRTLPGDTCYYTVDEFNWKNIDWCSFIHECDGKSHFAGANDDNPIPGVPVTVAKSPRDCRNKHIYCTSYGARLKTCNSMPEAAPWSDFCSKANQITFPRNQGDCSQPSGAKAWWDNKPNPDHFYVFHSCTGAGLMQDCAGFTKYAEIYGKVGQFV